MMIGWIKGRNPKTSKHQDIEAQSSKTLNPKSENRLSRFNNPHGISAARVLNLSPLPMLRNAQVRDSF